MNDRSLHHHVEESCVSLFHTAPQRTRRGIGGLPEIENTRESASKNMGVRVGIEPRMNANRRECKYSQLGVSENAWLTG